MLTAVDAAILDSVSDDLFDDAVDPALVAEFLADPRHHLAVALDRGRIVGFASGVHYVHPDKPTELWINEVGVAPTHQGRGIGKAVVRTLLQHARRLGCREAWVLTDRSNDAAMRLYASAGGEQADGDHVMFNFPLDATGDDSATG
jgi:aminoglycoside 6'-N-acetyltransferase I